MIQIDILFFISALLTRYFLIIYFLVIDIIKFCQPQKLPPIFMYKTLLETLIIYL